MEIRTIAKMKQGKNNKIVGYASVFNSPARLPDSTGSEFIEVVRPGSFTRALKETPDIKAFFNHDLSSIPLARTSKGTLRLSEDTRGLRFDFDIPDTTQGRDLAASIRAGNIDGASFGFVPVKERWTRTGETPMRELLEVRLVEVSLTPMPAYSATSVDVRSKQSEMAEENNWLDLEILLRDPRYSDL